MSRSALFSKLVIGVQTRALATMGGGAYTHAAVLWHRSAIRFRGAIYHETHV